MKYLNIVLTLFAAVLVSCATDSTGDVSSVTNYPIITLNGDEVVYVEQGSAYNEPGAVAMEGETEIPTEITYSPGSYYGNSGVDINTPDQYTVSYSAINADGFAGNALRTVWVVPPTGDLVNSIEGLYTSSAQRAPTFTPSSQYEDMEYVVIAKIGANTYSITHAIGGYYDMGRGHGSGYAAAGAVITANDISSNDFSISQAAFPIWGNTVDISGFTVDPATKMITFTGDGNFGNGTFKVQLKQVQF